MKGVEKQPGKNQNCKATMSTRLYPCNKDHRDTYIDKCFNLRIELVYDHTHEVESTNSHNFLNVEESSKVRLL